MKTSVHDNIRDWLIEFGQKNGFEAWTPDKKSNVEFSKVRNTKIDYRPDVVWKRKRGREKLLFELAFQEDFRAVVGEMFLASQAEGFTKMYFIRPTSDRPYWENIQTYLRRAFQRHDGIVQTHHRPTFVIFERSLEKDGKEDEIRKRIIDALKDDRWI